MPKKNAGIVKSCTGRSSNSWRAEYVSDCANFDSPNIIKLQLKLSQLLFLCHPGFSYQLQYSVNLNEEGWIVVGPTQIPIEDDTIMNYTDSLAVGQERRFYQVKKTPDP
jgi:hypothetical protein